MSEQTEHFDFISEHTILASELATLRGLSEKGPNGEEMFAGRAQIGRDSFPINGMVDIRTWVADGEAIVVDSVKYPEGFKVLSDKYENKFADHTDEEGEYRVLHSIYEAVDETMRYDPVAVENDLKDSFGPENKSRKVSLDDYLIQGFGVCRHMALAASWLGGDLADKGLLTGRLTAEVNQRSDNSAHEWARYTATDGTVYIIDPAQHFFGTLEEASKSAHWEYMRPEEINRFAPPVEAEQPPLELDKYTQDTVDWLDSGTRKFSEVETHYASMQQKMSAETVETMLPATGLLMAKGVELVENLVEELDFPNGARLNALADEISEVLSINYGVELERIYPRGFISLVSEQKQWLRITTNTVQNLIASQSADPEAILHIAMVINRRLNQEVKLKVNPALYRATRLVGKH